MVCLNGIGLFTAMLLFSDVLFVQQLKVLFPLLVRKCAVNHVLIYFAAYKDPNLECSQLYQIYIHQK